MTHPTVPSLYVDCPRCGGAGFDDVDETGCPYTCYFCCETGRVLASVVAEEEASAALALAAAEAEEAARRALFGVPAGWSYRLDDEHPDGIVMIPPRSLTPAQVAWNACDDDIPF
jgi:hypothetical protein